MDSLPPEILEEILSYFTNVQDVRAWINACASFPNFKELLDFKRSLQKIQYMFGPDKCIWPEISITIKDPLQDPRIQLLKSFISPFCRFYRVISFGKSPKMIASESNLDSKMISYCQAFISSKNPLVTLSICHANLSMESVQSFVSSLTLFHRVSFVKCKINDKALELLLHGLKKCPLEHLSFENCLLGESSCYYISEFIRLSKLKRLDLTFVYIDEIGGKELSEAIFHSKLTQFNLWDSRLSVDSIPYFSAKLKNLKISLDRTKVILSE